MDVEKRLSADDFIRHRGPITCVAGIPGSRRALTAGYDSAVALVDFDAGSIKLLGYQEHLANRVVVSPDGRMAASCSSDYTICLWDLTTFEPVRVLRGHWDDVEDFAFADRHIGVSASRDRRILVWNLDSGAIIRTLERHDKDVLSVDIADGRIYSSGDDMTMRQWDLATGEELRVWGPFEQETDTCAFDPVHRRAVLGADDGCIYIFDESDQPPATIQGHAAGIKKVAVSPRTGDILSAAYDRRLRVWSADNLAAKLELEYHPACWERSLSWTPDGRFILAGTFDGTVLAWNAETGALVSEIGRAGDERGAPGNACLNDVAAAPDGDIVVVADDGILRLGRLAPGVAAWRGERVPDTGRVLMNAVAMEHQHPVVIAGAHDHVLRMFRRDGDRLLDERAVFLGEGPINCIRVAHCPGHEGEVFAACYNHAVVRLSPAGDIVTRIQLHEGAVKALRLHRERPMGVSCGADGLLLSWTFEGEPIERFSGHVAIVDDVDIDPAGTLVASAGRDFLLTVHELDTGRLVTTLPTGRQSPKCLCFWDSATVLMGNYWGYILRFDLDTGTVERARIAENGISSVSRAGDHLVAVSYDGAAFLVHPHTLAVASVLRAMVQKVAVPPVTARL